ncbi:hypothetical protein ADIWIN_3211 [Winogradskyella psychrotolerans RS-3]|uniref:Uncharacterized protein n=1 Tax=Winogradskyella psychrotolerans RS-3 TaxID=641526 RepID=S7VMU8_9FLAO|nr:hypothetical protein ADIWIN_3211 [Winogradskyella psychrotolerans RS-3]
MSCDITRPRPQGYRPTSGDSARPAGFVADRCRRPRQPQLQWPELLLPRPPAFCWRA